MLSENDMFSDRNKCYTSATTPFPAPISLATVMRDAEFRSFLCMTGILCIDVVAHVALVEEKNTRARIRSEADRRLTKSTIVILDALNFVKGYRYELWCLARAAGTKCCVLWVDTPIETCRQWNTARCPKQVRTSIATPCPRPSQSKLNIMTAISLCTA